jgi:hypothetical protein
VLDGVNAENESCLRRIRELEERLGEATHMLEEGERQEAVVRGSMKQLEGEIEEAVGKVEEEQRGRVALQREWLEA